ncbi:hypothetical protein WMF31_24015 [Sorangium sp. So ce1036]|uniref:hypothetical protein n=1 Tax=Sorangium sp. So ce1036 TaxID=3133328 RepID=UPI003F01143F
MVRPPRQIPLVLSLALALTPSLAPAQSSSGAAPKPAPAPANAAPRAPAATGAPRAGDAGQLQAPSQRPAPARKPARKPKQKDAPPDTGRPLATFPGFRVLPTGGSRVFVQIHGGKVDVSESKAEGRLVYRMKGTGAIQTNRFPLVTAFFPTPVTRVQLVAQGDDLDMVIDLRAPSAATYQVIETEQGSVLQVDFPPAVPEQRAAPQAAGQPERAVPRALSQPPEDDGGAAAEL